MNYFGAALGILISLSFKEIHWITGGLLGWLIFALYETRADLKSAKEQLASLKPKKSQTKKKAVEAVQNIQKSISKTADEKPATKAIKAAKAAPKKKTPTKKEPEPQLAGSFFNLIIDFFKGDKGLVRIGVVILLIGISFLMKTITPFIEITPLMKVSGIALAGLAFIGAGHYLKKDKEVYGLSLMGTGLAVLFLDTYAAYFMFELLSYKVALPLTCVIGGAGLALSLKNNSLSLAVLALGGGFVAPILSGVAKDIPDIYVFAYYLILNAIVLSTAYYKSWRLLNILGFLSTFVLIPQWYAPQDIPLMQMMLATFFILYLAVSILFARKEVVNNDGYVDSLITFALPFAILAFNEFPMRDIEYGYAYTSASMALVYGFTALILQGQKQMQGIRLSFMALAAILGTLTIPLVFDAREVGALWALEGAAAVWLGLRQGSRSTATAGIILQLLAGGALILEYLNPFASHTTGLPIFNPEFISFMSLAVAGLFTSYITGKDKGNASLYCTLWGMTWLFTGLFREILIFGTNEYLTSPIIFYNPADPVIYFAGYNLFVLAFVLITAGFQCMSNKLKWKDIGLLSPIYTPAVFTAGIWIEATMWHKGLGITGLTVLPFGWITWITAIAVHFMLLKQLPEKKLSISCAIGLLGSLSFAAYESFCILGTSNIITDNISYFHSELVGFLLFSAALWFIPYKGIQILSPFKKRADTYQNIALPIIAVVVILFILFEFTHGYHKQGVYIPLLYSAELVNLFALYVLFIYQKKLPIYLQNYKTYLTLGWGALCFIFINTVLARTIVEYSGATSYNMDELWNDNTFLAATSILWTTIALAMVLYGARIQHRTLWLTGAGLICVVVGKLFLVDISQASMIAKTVSFIATGLMLVGVGYFSPIPPASKK
ncbi:MAG: DUF2339 domain-containing protein [Pseudomonadota bacterium]|nr:DUF2339 domain-containing protein [Pseudomonadota bacterium]